MIHSIVLVSGIKQNELVIHISTLFFKFFSYAGPSAYAGGETPWKADRLISVSVGLRQ